MPIMTQARIVRADLRSNPEVLYVFGDNFARTGYGGLAAACRGEPNAVGIPTKRAPSNAAEAFLSDSDTGAFNGTLNHALDRLYAHLDAGGIVVLPAAGIGTGLARMAEKAPLCFAALQTALRDLRTPVPGRGSLTTMTQATRGRRA